MLALHPLAAAQLDRLGRTGVRYRVTSGYRSKSAQQILYRQWRAGQRTIPVAAPGTSTHQWGLAIDMVPIAPSSLPDLVAAARAIGLVWAGPRDPVHFQVLDQATWRAALRLSPRRPLDVLTRG